MLKVIVTAILVVALLAGGTISVLAQTGNATGNVTGAPPPLDIADIEALVGELEGVEEFEIMPEPLPGRTATIDGGFRGVWGRDNATNSEPPGVLGGLYGRVQEPDGSGSGYFGGIWKDKNGGPGGYLQGRYANGYFWGVWRCLETGARGILGGTYVPAPGATSDVPHRFSGIWITRDGQQTGYLKGTWSPAVQSQPAGRFAGQWTHDNDVTAAQVAPDGRLSGTYHRLELADGSSIRYFKGRWSSNEGARGRLGGLVHDGGFYGLWNSRNSDAQGYLKGAWADHRFRGVWGYTGQEPGGRLWGRYGPYVTPEPLEAEPLPVPQVVEPAGVRPAVMAPARVTNAAGQPLTIRKMAVVPFR
jgi:hypothetical protein